MKSYNGLYNNMLNEENLRQAFLDASLRKRKRSDVKKVLSNLDTEIPKLKDILEKEEFAPATHTPCTINEYNCRKERTIVKPFYKYEQVVHHLVVNQLKPIVMNGFYEFSCGSIPERGCHYGKKYVQKWIKSYEGEDFYVLKMDIKHFFENIDHDILKGLLSEVIRDKRFLKLLFQLIDANEIGIPLGYYTSQWFANFYLKRFDHYVKEVLGAEHYIRYMDDMIIFDRDKDKIHHIQKEVQKYLSEKLNVSLKETWQIFPFCNADDTKGRFLDFMGFKFYRNKTTIRKSIICRARRKAKRLAKKSTKITWYDATGMISYMGWFTYTNTYDFYLKYIKPFVSLRSLKAKVSKHSRKENRHDKLERSKRNTVRKAIRGRYLFEYHHCVYA